MRALAIFLGIVVVVSVVRSVFVETDAHSFLFSAESDWSWHFFLTAGATVFFLTLRHLHAKIRDTMIEPEK